MACKQGPLLIILVVPLPRSLERRFAVPKTQPGGVPLTIEIDGSSSVPLYQQLYEGIRDAILRGSVAAGTRLPATRTLAADLGVSRNTVLIAFDQLLAEGYVEGKIGSGTYVSRDLPEKPLQSLRTTFQKKSAAKEKPRLARRAAQFTAVPIEASWVRHDVRPFQPGLTALDAFPFKTWSRLVARHWRRSPTHLLSYGDPAGYRPLREAIAAYLGPARGVRCTADQVILTGGGQRGMNLVVQVLLDKDDAAWLEDPGHLNARQALMSMAVRVVPVPVDVQGLDVAAGIQRCANARVAFVTPSHQYPVGVTLSLPRRLELIEWARQSGAWIVEDDWGSEFRYGGRPQIALQGLDRHRRVIYLGSFAEVLFPGLRLGYVVVPPELIEPFTAARALLDLLPMSVEQAALKDFIGQGHFNRHLRRMRTLYAEKQNALVKAAERHLSGLLDVQPSEAGTHIVGWLPPRVCDVAAAQQCALQGVATIALSAYAMEPVRRGGLLLGYCALSTSEIQQGVRKLADALRRRR